MSRSSPKKVAFLSSFPPRKCGIANFTSDLIKNLTLASKGHIEPLVVALRTDNELRYSDPVKFEIRQNVKSDYICAADYVNFSNVDLVSVQHEFGLFGGPGGSFLGLLLKKLNAPVITTLHTVLDNPETPYRRAMEQVCSESYRVVTMNERGVKMLGDIYGLATNNVELVPHGIPDLPFVDSSYYKHKFGMEGRRTILTFGLLNRNKGIENMLRAMPEIVKTDPSVLYIILGMTHPIVLKSEGESYRLKLQRIVNELGLQENVVFHNRFVKEEELHNFLCAADIYVTPYLFREQLTSGTLSFAVGTGKAVVSTPYWAAEELLAEGRGILVPFADPDKLAHAVNQIIEDSSLFYSLRRRAYDYGRSRTWPKIGQKYWKLFNEKKMPISLRTETAPASVTELVSSIEVPEPSLEHLKELTDDTGLFQHAKFTVPDRYHGYTTDDNTRALIAMARYYAQYHQPEAFELFNKYLSFVLYAQEADGRVRNFMNFDRTWMKDEPVNDALGRFLWALGAVIAQPPSPVYISIVKEPFDLSVGLVEQQYPRGMAYSILGMNDYLKQFPGASEIKRQMEVAADQLASQFRENSHTDWKWFEDILTYDNAVLPHSLFVAAMVLGKDSYQEIARESCEFLLQNIFSREHFSFIGCNGWYERGARKAQFDQQPIEACSCVLMLRSAYNATGNERYLTLQRKAFDWFLGENDLQVPLYDFPTKGCCDGLMQGGVNVNQGAESMVSFLLGLLSMIESYSMLNKSKNKPQVQLHRKNNGDSASGSRLSIRGITRKSRPKEFRTGRKA